MWHSVTHYITENGTETFEANRRRNVSKRREARNTTVNETLQKTLLPHSGCSCSQCMTFCRSKIGLISQLQTYKWQSMEISTTFEGSLIKNGIRAYCSFQLSRNYTSLTLFSNLPLVNFALLQNRSVMRFNAQASVLSSSARFTL